VKTQKELIAYAKANPGKVSIAHGGNGTAMHLSAALFNQMSGAGMIDVPYKGSGPAALGVLAGQVSLAVVDLPSALAQIEAGKVVAYAVTSPQRLRSLPEVPTVGEAGLPGYDSTGWFGVVAPAATPCADRRPFARRDQRGAERRGDQGERPQARRRAGAGNPGGLRGLHPLGDAEVGQGHQDGRREDSTGGAPAVRAMKVEDDVVVVGAGPVGLTLAIDLAWRGVKVIVAETRAFDEAPNVVITSRRARWSSTVASGSSPTCATPACRQTSRTTSPSARL
jgi:hypothetical protein